MKSIITLLSNSSLLIHIEYVKFVKYNYTEVLIFIEPFFYTKDKPCLLTSLDLFSLYRLGYSHCMNLKIECSI